MLQKYDFFFTYSKKIPNRSLGLNYIPYSFNFNFQKLYEHELTRMQGREICWITKTNTCIISMLPPPKNYMSFFVAEWEKGRIFAPEN